jgi:hypothetical protein
MATSYKNGIPGSFDKRGVWREFPWNADFMPHFRNVRGKWVFLCRQCGMLTQARTSRGYAAHEVALCSSECLSGRVGRITVQE